ncbi:MAG: ferrous iron transport protein B, partial [Caldilineaceae bacterium]|nr:ferrous iron transport protein B [Caldilineaceae bacterium]
MVARAMTVALAGNPNVGKSTLFNALTGSRQHVGNWPGKTVEKKEGRLHLAGQEIVVVDLPGTYSMTAYSIEELISRDFIVNERPSVVVAVADASNLERNLYLVTQLLELETPLILALNMTDIAHSHGLAINVARLAQELSGIPVIETAGGHRLGIAALKQAIEQATAQPDARVAQRPLPISYGELLDSEIDALEAAIRGRPELADQYLPRWLAIKLLEWDAGIVAQLEEAGQVDLLAATRAAMARVESTYGEDAETLIADQRYAFISRVVAASVTRPARAIMRRSEQIDRVLTHRVWGVPIFLFIMWIVFQFIANVSAPTLDWVDGIISGPMARGASALMAALGLGGGWAESLIVDALIAGVGGVLAFVPVLMTLYFAIGILEDSGYMARAAFVMDRVMRTMGLHGKSFLPMLVGFGCTVPAVYATRAMDNMHDRQRTGFLLTFMSCGARLPVYVLIGAAFFGSRSGNLIFAMYLLGIAVALVTGIALRITVDGNTPPRPFVMELPPYRAPHLRDVWRQTWERTSGFVRKAGTVILASTFVIWLLLAIPLPGAGQFHAVPPEESLFGATSRTLAPLFAPAGFGNWQSTGSLLTGMVAKEVIVSTMNQVVADGVQENSTAGAPTSLAGELAAIGTSFVETCILTAQEIVNIVPR